MTPERPPVRCSLLVATDWGREGPADVGRFLRQYAETAEAMGFHGLYVPTDIGWDRPNPLTLAAALGAWTERVRVGTCTLAAPLIDPLSLAEAALTIHAATGGRFVLGISLGWNPVDIRAAGMAPASRKARLEEHLAVLPDLLAGRAVEHTGRYYDVHTAPLGLAQGQPPPAIWLGAHGPAGIARAARLGTWIGGPFTTAGQLERQLGVLHAAANAPERRPVLMRECVIAPTRAEARGKLEFIRAKYSEYAAKVPGMAFDPAVDPEQMAEDRVVWGDPESCARAARRFAALADAEELVLRVMFRGMAPDAAIADLKLLGAEVLPALSDVGAP